MSWSGLLNVTISTYRIVYVDGYAYASGPTGTGTFPADFGTGADWDRWREMKWETDVRPRGWWCW